MNRPYRRIINMKYNPEKHHRKSIRLKRYDYSENGAYFITICIQHRECLFGEIVAGEMRLNGAGMLAQKWWLELKNKYPHIELDEYVIMPNHFHGIITIQNETAVGAIHESPLRSDISTRRKMTLSKIVGYFKMNSAKYINQLLNTKEQKLWQRNYYEHIIRNEQSLTQIQEYIINNPSNWEQDELFERQNRRRGDS
jgi:putative transposase